MLLALGGIYLLVRKVITWHIPVAFIGTVAALTFIFPQNGNNISMMLAELCTGGLMLGAIFMATDYATSPVTAKGRLIYGVGCGCVTVFIRYFGGYNEGVSFAILMMNMLVWYIDRLTMPTVFGTRRKKTRANTSPRKPKEGGES
jgi:electron transport complex protein RnfD